VLLKQVLDACFPMGITLLVDHINLFFVILGEVLVFDQNKVLSVAVRDDTDQRDDGEPKTEQGSSLESFKAVASVAFFNERALGNI